MIAEYLNTVLEEGTDADTITAIGHIAKALCVKIQIDVTHERADSPVKFSEGFISGKSTEDNITDLRETENPKRKT